MSYEHRDRSVKSRKADARVKPLLKRIDELSNNTEVVSFHCSTCGKDFVTDFYFDTQKTSLVRGHKKIQRRKQTGCPFCHHSCSIAVYK